MKYLCIYLMLVAWVYSNGLREPDREKHWMLDEETMLASRGGHKRNDISLYTKGNQLQYLIDGEDFMKALYEDIQKTQKGDYIHATFFEEEVKVMLLPNASDIKGSEKTSVYNIVKEATAKGVTVRFLANFNLFHSYLAIPFCWSLNTVCGYTCCGMETRHHNWILGNLHTKMWVIKMGNETVVYNGGMDVAGGRWDTHYHDNSPERIMDYDFLGIDSMHDVMFRMRGPVVRDISRHFYQRWNDPYPSFFPFQSLPKYNWVEPPYAPPVENGISVQLLRTAACKGAQSGYYSNFAPRGEISALRGLLKLIEKAKKFIYIEDQFLDFPYVFEKLRKKLENKEVKFVIILTNNQSTPPLLSESRYSFQYMSMKNYIVNKTSNKLIDGFHMFQLVRETDYNSNLYLHAKTFLADDEYLIGGSFGIEQAGLTTDLDIGIGVHDPTNNFIKEVRKRLWAEHLMIEVNDTRLEDPIKTLDLWLEEADMPMRRIKTYFPKRVDFSIINAIVYEFFENTGLCEDQKLP